MRAMKLFAVAALLAAIAAAATPASNDAQAAGHTAEVAAKKTQSSLAGALAAAGRAAAHMSQRGQGLRKGAAALKRTLRAQQSTTCDQEAFADSTSRVLQACPSLSGLVSGTTSLEEFLPGFCGSECHTVLATEMSAHAACLDSDSMFLVTFIETCANRPRCFSAEFIVPMMQTEAQCSVGLMALLDPTNFTAAAVADAQTFCSSDCHATQVAMLRNFPECMRDESTGQPMPTAELAGAIDVMCATRTGSTEVCGVTLKAFGKLSCDVPSVCRASNSFCTAGCQPELTNGNLDLVCSECTQNLMPYLRAFGEDPAMMAAGLEIMCTKKSSGPATAENPYCFPVFMTAVAAQGSASTICSGVGVKECTPKVAGLAATSGKLMAYATFRGCVGQVYQYYGSGSTALAQCLPTLETSLREAEVVGSLGRVACAQNAAGLYCADRVSNFTAAAMHCQSVTNLQGYLTETGCCAPLINDFMRSFTSVPSSVLPPGTQYVKVPHTELRLSYTHTSQYARRQLTRADQPMQLALTCIGNTTEQWRIVETPCPPTLASPPRSSVPVNLAWSRVSSDARLKARLEDSMRQDVARGMNVEPRRVVNGTLVEGSGSIQLRSSTRRQTTSTSTTSTTTTTTGSNCVYDFAVDGATATEAEAAIAALQSEVSGGTFVTAQTSTEVTTSCMECLDARSTTLINAAAPPPGAAPPPASSATSAAVAVAALFAAVVASFAL